MYLPERALANAGLGPSPERLATGAQLENLE